MANIGDMTVRIHADTRELDRALGRIQRRLWWNKWGLPVLVALNAGMMLLGLGIGLLIR